MQVGERAAEVRDDGQAIHAFRREKKQDVEHRDKRGDDNFPAELSFLDNAYADFSNSSRPISMRRISEVPAPIS